MVIVRSLSEVLGTYVMFELFVVAFLMSVLVLVELVVLGKYNGKK